MNVLELENVSKSFSRGFVGRRHQVLSGLSLRLQRGEVYGFLGHDGAGKTTTMRIIMGLVKPDWGRIRLLGQDGATRDARARTGFLGENVGLYPHLDAEETLRFTGELFRLGGAALRSKTEHFLELVGLKEVGRLKVKNYSKGMRQRLGLAVALMNEPDLLLLDEPYSALDPIGRRDLRRLFLSLKGDGKTILLSSHIVPDVEAISDRVGILRGGSLGYSLDLHEIYAQKSDQAEVTVSGVDSSWVASLNEGLEVIYTNEEVSVVRCEGETELKAFITKVYEFHGNVVEVKPVKFDLEDFLVEALQENVSLEEELPQVEQEREDYATSR